METTVKCNRSECCYNNFNECTKGNITIGRDMIYHYETNSNELIAVCNDFEEKDVE